MINRCKICGQKTLFFMWSTSRTIDKEKLEQIDQFKGVPSLNRLAYPICWGCVKEHTLIVSSKEVKDEI